MPPALRLVEVAEGHAGEWAWFCSHCAAPPPGGLAPAPVARVCRACGLGLLLETRRDALPGPNDAFLVIDSAMRVQAMSRAAQSLLAVGEPRAVNRPVCELLEAADAEGGVSRLSAAIVAAAEGGEEPATAFVRPWNTFGVRMRARIAPCGPPRAALIVLQARQARRLRAV